MSQAHPSPDRDRLLELLADQAALGLSPAEQSELQRLLTQFPDVNAEEFDLLAAAIDLAFEPAVHEPLPEALRTQISRRALDAASFGGQSSTSPQVERRPPPQPLLAPWLGWLVAAACLVVAAFAWWAGSRPQGPANAEVALRQLLAEPGTTETPLAALDEMSGASGDIVWNERAQRGFMRLRGLAVNDPKLRQYQLWIFDKNQDERYPIDGGVFDVGRDGEVIVPIRAAIKVVDPTMYAITVEKPGGVVVSSREEIVLLGKVSG